MLGNHMILKLLFKDKLLSTYRARVILAVIFVLMLALVMVMHGMLIGSRLVTARAYEVALGILKIQETLLFGIK
jgi:hypothetical protein